MTELQQEELRKKLLTYPGVTEENVEEYLISYEIREEQKQMLTGSRGMTNSQAEAFLDRQGHPRPPGWGSVFKYPQSSQLRWSWLIVLIVIAIVLGATFF